MTKQSTQGQRGKSPETRFWEKVRKEDSCWIWTSAIGSRGYGVFWKNAAVRSVFAHRFSYQLAKGEIPEGAGIMHSCDNPACVNPDHLTPGSILDNAMDAKSKGRLAVGAKNGGGRKLSEDQVREIFLLKGKIGGARTARMFGVSKVTINSIRNGKIWRCVTEHMGA